MKSTKLKVIFLISLIFLFVQFSFFSQSDNVPQSFDPPGGLSVDQVPLFIVLGFDDNRYVDGMEWVLNLLESKRNPVGSSNPLTFDNKPIGASFYYISNIPDGGNDNILNTWKRAVQSGHEVGNRQMYQLSGVKFLVTDNRKIFI